MLEDCYRVNKKSEKKKAKNAAKHISGVAVKANRVSMEVEDAEFGDVASWNALCFGQSVHSMNVVRSIIENKSEASCTPKNSKKIKPLVQRSF